MHKINMGDTVRAWYMSNPVKQSGNNADSCLFEMLYDSYCRIVHNGRSFKRNTAAEGSYVEDCSEMFNWYQDRYLNLGLKKGGRGQKRYVTGDEATYSFSRLYSDDRQFRGYLLTDTPQAGNQDLFCFIVHTAVAFLAPPKELDKVLQKLGFHPLHVRNIHHLAIYAVLSEAQNIVHALPETYNPFELVKNLYDTATVILQSGGCASEDVLSYENLLTLQIRQKLFLENGLNYENFEKVVRSNVQDLTRRHSLILNDFHKLTAVYTAILEDYAEEEEAYSFYQLFNRFCTPLEKPKFRDYLGTMIDNQNRHPTRQIMILLWLYDYCFSFVEGIELGEKTYSKILAKLGKYNKQWPEEAAKHWKGRLFDAYGFINNMDGSKGLRRRSRVFEGSEFRTIIDEKLMLDYGWGSLNMRLPFDYVIAMLCTLDISQGNRSTLYRIRSDMQECTDRYAGNRNAPYSLMIVMDVLCQLKEVIAERSVWENKKEARDISPYPLDCRIYEKI